MSDRITSSANVHVKRAAALLSKPKTRREEGAFAVEGLRLFLDTPESFIEEVFLTDSAALCIGWSLRCSKTCRIQKRRREFWLSCGRRAVSSGTCSEASKLRTAGRRRLRNLHAAGQARR